MTFSCAVAIPIYRNPTPSERFSLFVAEKFLSRENCFIVAPNSLKFYSKAIKVIRLPDDWFCSIEKYGSLMVSKSFYELFDNYDYILVYQLDCLVFGARLNEFTAFGFDYVAPLILGRSDGFWPNSDIVGVGGFSLRKVSSFLKVLELIDKPSFSAELSRLACRIERNGAEDMFWSLAASTIDPGFSVASPEIALAFGFEGDPRKSYLRAHRQQPFGCHHWNKLSFFLWYLPWIPLPLSQSLRLIPTVLAELAISEVMSLLSRIWRRAARIFPWLIRSINV